MSAGETDKVSLPTSREIIDRLVELETWRIEAHISTDRLARQQARDFAEIAAEDAALSEAESEAYVRKVTLLGHFFEDILGEVNLEARDSEPQTEPVEVMNVPGVTPEDFFGAMVMAAEGLQVPISAIAFENIPVLIQPGDEEGVVLVSYRRLTSDHSQGDS